MRCSTLSLKILWQLCSAIISIKINRVWYFLAHDMFGSLRTECRYYFLRNDSFVSALPLKIQQLTMRTSIARQFSYIYCCTKKTTRMHLVRYVSVKLSAPDLDWQRIVHIQETCRDVSDLKQRLNDTWAQASVTALTTKPMENTAICMRTAPDHHYDQPLLFTVHEQNKLSLLCRTTVEVFARQWRYNTQKELLSGK